MILINGFLKELVTVVRVMILINGFLLLQPPSTVKGYSYSRTDFPSHFIFGSGSSAYQVEGAAFEDGRTPSIWDTYAHAGYVDGYTGDIACDQYHKYKEDVQLMVDTGLDAYRFSISWSRLIPNGKGPVNLKAVEYYNNLLNELIFHGIQPHVVLLHMDIPQALEDNYGGWVNQQIVEDFTAYANVCFREFGDRVLYWTTYNEPNMFAEYGYDHGLIPPQRCSEPFGSCTQGNSTTEPYLAAHNLLLAHASVVRLYRKTYQGKQHGFIGLNLYAESCVPETNSEEDLLAVQRARDFRIGWFMDPLVFGDYPDVMKKSVGGRLPSFLDHESELVKSSFDFIGVNVYTTIGVKDNTSSLTADLRDFDADRGVELIYRNDGERGVQGVLEYFKQKYGNPPLYIHENGYRTERSASLEDTSRVEYLNASIGYLLDALRNGSNTRGYFLWSFLDMFELGGGYKWGFGIYYVDLDDPDLKRYPKLSAHWYSALLKGENSNSNGIIQQASNFTIISKALSDK